MLKRIRHTGRELLSPDAWKTRLVFWTGAVVVGLLATGFAIASEHANALFHAGTGQLWYLPFIACPLGLMLVAWLTQRFFPGTQGSGIPQSIAALQLSDHASRSRLLSFRIAFGKIGLCLLGMLSGASIGREGPTVHVGAAVMFSLGRFAKFPNHYMDHGLILAGGAAGIAAAFNTPLAGILFAIEEMGRSFEQRTSGTLLTAVFIAGITAVAIQGNYTYFGSNTSELAPADTLVPVFACGIIGGALGGLFSLVLVSTTRRAAPWLRRWPLRVAFGCGLLLAILGALSGGLSFGTGYQEARLIITGEGELPGSYPFYKMLATWVSYLSGIPGGIFAPSLAAGAGVGSTLAEWLPAYPVGVIVMLGMVGYFTGVVQTPITAFVIVMEMTDNTGLVLPLMATAFIAQITSRIVSPDPLYRTLAQSFLPGKKTS